MVVEDGDPPRAITMLQDNSGIKRMMKEGKLYSNLL